MGTGILIAGVALWLLSALPAVVPGANRPAKECSSAVLAVAGSVFGIVGALLGDGGSTAPARGSSAVLGVDGLSSLFLLPIFLISGLVAVYGLGYQPPGSPHGRFQRVFQAILTVGMVLLVVARNGLLFLCGWELMALAAFVLIATEHDSAAARRAAWVYLVATHVATLALFAAVALLQAPGGSLDWQPETIAALPRERLLLAFALAMVGFATKAGLMPFHVWLPAAHANAQSHVSALLSGVVVKMGLYGTLRFSLWIPTFPVSWAVVIVALGVLSAVVGAASMMTQTDLKRLLAYSTIDNIGVVFIGIGLALLGRAIGRPELFVLGLGGALFHVLNHSLFKSLLFLCAGSVVHATGTRDIERLGGLSRRMPSTMIAFTIGAAAISAVPILNGFVSEFLVYLGLFTAAALPPTGLALLATAFLTGMTLMGGLAILSFVRVTSALFAGRPRSAAAAGAHESPRTMTAPVMLLAAMCVGIGLVPMLCVPLVDDAIAVCRRDGVVLPLGQLAPFWTMTALAIPLAVAITIAIWWLRARARAVEPGAAEVGTWDCGFVDATSPRLQYTASSMAQTASGILRWVAHERREPVSRLELFPGPRRFVRRAVEPLLESVLWPWFRRLAERCSRLRVLQRGKLQIYLLYILVTLLALLVWSVIPVPRTP